MVWNGYRAARSIPVYRFPNPVLFILLLCDRDHRSLRIHRVDGSSPWYVDSRGIECVNATAWRLLTRLSSFRAPHHYSVAAKYREVVRNERCV